MSTRTQISAIAAFVAVAAAASFASHPAAAHNVRHATQQHRSVTLPADAYGAVDSVVPEQSVRPSQLTGGLGHDFQLEGRF
jgi:hypothetical protein